MNNQEIIEIVKAKYPHFNILAITMIGSRTFGVPKENSDYDIRFVYSRPVRDYIGIDKVPEQTKQSISDKIDLIGYDAQYFFRLLSKSNQLAAEFLRALKYNPIYTTQFIQQDSYRAFKRNLNQRYIIKKYLAFMTNEIKKGKFDRINTLFSHISDILKGGQCGEFMLFPETKYTHDEFLNYGEELLKIARTGNEYNLKRDCEIFLKKIMKAEL